MQIIEPSFFEDNNSIKSISLTSLRGSQGIHLEFVNEKNEVIRRAEIETLENETIDLKLTHCNKVLTLTSSRQHPIRYLPNHNNYIPVRALKPNLNTQNLDILFLIDSTMRQKKQFCVENQQFIAELNKKLQDFINELQTKHKEINTSIMTFGDIKNPHINNTEDLTPDKVFDYLLGSEEFAPWNANAFEGSLKQLSGIHGADYTDALAESLEKIQSSERYWRNDARRVLVLIGDSPGFSILNPAPLVNGIGINIVPRHYDVESQAKKLHQQNIEIITLYVDNNSDANHSTFKSIFDYTRKQYENMASTKEHYAPLNFWDIQKTASMLTSLEEEIGYGYCKPKLI